ncbi:autotransporter outer membrane beta-barrel domain-containing protein, partial [Rhizobium sp. P38BS-XIX]|uniref:beta strand repeat-containing protein n=1 Tax=Rhizobium sp. P38BS-XIX TaxID=2726740 RepID=UPI00182DED3B
MNGLRVRAIVKGSDGVAVESSAATLTVTASAPTITYSPAAPAAATVGAAYSQSIASASGGAAPYTYTITSGTLPAGLSLASNGTISGTATAAGTFPISVKATDSSTGSGPFSSAPAPITITVGSPVIVLSPSAGALPGGTVGSAYSQTVSASGGTSPYSYSLTAGALPVGLSLNSSTGGITGTPTAGGTFNFTITAADSSTGTGAPFTTSNAYSITTSAPTITIAPATLADAPINHAYSETLTASGGISPYSFAVTTGSLPAGLTLSPSGLLSGTPTGAATTNFTVTATDSSTGTGPYTQSKAYSLVTTANPPVAGNTTAAVAANSSANPVTLNLTGGTATAVAIATAPSHGTAIASGTAIAYTPNPGYVGSDSFTYTASNIDGTSAAATVSVTINAPTLSIGPASLPAAAIAASYNATVTASGGTSPYSYAVTAGSLPAGLSLNASTGAIIGSPTAGGVFNFTITATDSSIGTGAPFTVSIAYSLNVAAPTMSISPPTLPSGTIAALYNETVTASGGSTPYSYAVSAGALPAGLTLNTSTGEIAGTPTAGGNFNFTITATDSSTGTGAPYTASRPYTLTIAAPTLSVTPSTLPGAALNVAYSQPLTASGGTSPYSYAVTAGALPQGLTLSSGGLLSGTPTSAGTFNFTVSATDS